MKARKIADAQELVSRANGDKKVQKMIGKKPPPGKKGRPASAAKATAKATAKAKAKAKGGGEKVDHEEVEPCEDPSEKGDDDAADDGVVNGHVGDVDSVEPTNAKKAAPNLAEQWAVMDSWHFVLSIFCCFLMCGDTS